MDKKWQDIHIIYEETRFKEPPTTYTIRQVSIKSVTTTDLFIKINIVDTNDNKNTIIVPKLNGVKVEFD